MGDTQFLLMLEVTMHHFLPDQSEVFLMYMYFTIENMHTLTGSMSATFGNIHTSTVGVNLRMTAFWLLVS